MKLLPGDRTAGTGPKPACDRRTDAAAIPLDLTVRKLLMIGEPPLRIGGQLERFAASDDSFGEDFAFTINVTPVVPSFFYEALKRGLRAPAPNRSASIAPLRRIPARRPAPRRASASS